MFSYRNCLLLAMSFAIGAAHAQDTPASASGTTYLAAMGRAQLGLDGTPPGNGYGASLIAGVRRDAIGLELRASYASRDSANVYGLMFNGLVFPFERLPGLYGTAGIGLSEVQHYPELGNRSFSITDMAAGAGYLVPLKLLQHDVRLRAEVLYQSGSRNKRSQDQRPPAEDLPAATRFNDVVVQIGLHFPFGGTAPLAPATDAPASVVPAQPPPEQSDSAAVPAHTALPSAAP